MTPQTREEQELLPIAPAQPIPHFTTLKSLHEFLKNDGHGIPDPVHYVAKHVVLYGQRAAVPSAQIIADMSALLPTLRAARNHTIADAVSWLESCVDTPSAAVRLGTFGDLPMTVEYVALRRMGMTPTLPTFFENTRPDGSRDTDDTHKYTQWLLLLEELAEHFKKDLNE